MNTKIEDNLKTNDSIRGVLVFKDNKTGEVLFTKNNMIVKTGREYLRQLFIKASFSDYEGDLVGYELDSIKFGTSLRNTEFDDDISMYTFEEEYTVPITKSNLVWSVSNELKFTILVSGLDNAQHQISDVSIILKKEDSEDKLFSRANINPSLLDGTTELAIDYYIHF